MSNFAEYVTDGRVRAQQHPTLPLTIYNYSERVQYEKLWDEITLQCRGLVMHGDTVVARPFQKFFNDTEHTEGQIPWHLESEITEKMDGSLLIAFWFDGDWRFATRGSFTSEQAAVGEKILRAKYGVNSLDKELTYLFEVIYPANRIVLDYQGREDVVLLTAIRTCDGQEFPSGHDGLNAVRRLPVTANVRDLRSIIRDDEEGYVIRFANGFRVKVKGKRYMELHKILSGISTRSVWECLSENKPLDDVLAVAPDECAAWIREEADRQRGLVAELRGRVQFALGAVQSLPSRKEQALTLKEHYSDVMGPVFAALDGKPYDHILWKNVYPEFQRPRMAEALSA